MKFNKNSFWAEMARLVAAALTALATALGVSSCTNYAPVNSEQHPASVTASPTVSNNTPLLDMSEPIQVTVDYKN